MATGHDAVAKFLADTTQYLAELRRMQDETRRAKAQTESLIALIRVPLAVAAAGVKAAWWAITTPIKYAADILKTALGVMTGNLLSGGVQGIVGKFREWLTVGFQFNNILEEARVGFGVMFRDVATGTAVVEDLYKYAAYSVFEFENVSKAAQTLAAAGVKSTQIMPVLKMLGELGNTSTRPIEDIATLYAKIFAGGKVSGDEIRQFMHMGIPIIKELAEASGYSMDTIRKAVEENKIGVGEFQRALMTLTQEGGLFYGMQEKLSKTTPGIWATLKDSFRMALGEMASAFVEIFDLQKLMQSGVQFGNWLRDIIKEWTPIAKAWWDWFRDQAIDSFWKMTASLLESLATAYDAVGRIFSRVEGILTRVESIFDRIPGMESKANAAMPKLAQTLLSGIPGGSGLAGLLGLDAGVSDISQFQLGRKPTTGREGESSAAGWLRDLAEWSRSRSGKALLPPVPVNLGGDPFDRILNPENIELEAMRQAGGKKAKGGERDVYARAVGGMESWSVIAQALKEFQGDHEKKVEEELEKSNRNLEKVKTTISDERVKLLDGMIRMNDDILLAGMLSGV